MASRTGIVLQGGGALGAFEFGVLKGLYSALPGFEPDVVSGVSIGAINAACLAGAKGDPIATLNTLWDRLAVQWPFMPALAQRFAGFFGNPQFFTLRGDILAAPFLTSIYDIRPVRRLLADLIDFTKLNEGHATLLLTATDIETGQPAVFSNRNGQRITIDHILASASLPPALPFTRIGNKAYWDGGLFDNTPLKPAIDELNGMSGEKKRIYVINLFPNRGAIPGTMPEVLDRMIEIIFSNKLMADTQQACRIDEYLKALDALESQLPADALEKVKRDPAYRRVRARAHRVIDIQMIDHTGCEPAGGPSDFSRRSIRKRIEAGLEAARLHLAAAGNGKPAEAKAEPIKAAEAPKMKAAEAAKPAEPFKAAAKAPAFAGAAVQSPPIRPATTAAPARPAIASPARPAPTPPAPARQTPAIQPPPPRPAATPPKPAPQAAAPKIPKGLRAGKHKRPK